MEVIKILSDNAVCQWNEEYFKSEFLDWKCFIFQMNYLKNKGKILFVVSKIRQIQNYFF